MKRPTTIYRLKPAFQNLLRPAVRVLARAGVTPNQVTLGAILNEMGDVVSDVLLYLPLARVPGVDPMVISAVVVMAVITEMAGLTQSNDVAQFLWGKALGRHGSHR